MIILFVLGGRSWCKPILVFSLGQAEQHWNNRGKGETFFKGVTHGFVYRM